MAGGKHPAIRLGLSIVAVLVCAPPVSVLDQAPFAATFRILENGTAIGSAEIAVARDEDGWRVQSTSRAADTIGLDVPRLEISYDTSWRMRFLSMELARGNERRVIHVAVQSLRSRTDVVLPDREAGFGTHWISPGVIAVPDSVFGAYQALAARAEPLAPGSDIHSCSHREARSMQPLMRCVTRKCERRAGPFLRDECHCSSFVRFPHRSRSGLRRARSSNLNSHSITWF